jgi:hypothetical protein
MDLCQDKRSTMPAVVTYGFFIRIIQRLQRVSSAFYVRPSIRAATNDYFILLRMLLGASVW